MTDKIKPHSENPEIPSKNRRKEIATFFEPILNELFGRESQKCSEVKNDR